MDAGRRDSRRARSVNVNTRVNEWAPIALYIYRRPEHTRRTILSMLACQGASSSPIHVFADGPKTDADDPAVRATRAVAHELLDGRAVFVEHDRNLGLADSIISGTTQLSDQYGRVIVLEDDLVFSPYFLEFLNLGLQRYENDSRVMQICGYMFDVPSFRTRIDAIFLPMTSSLGWATWKRAWDQFDPNASGWRERLNTDVEAKRFNLGGRYDYFGLLKRQMNRDIDSWAIRWYYSVFSRSGLALFPPRTLVVHTGFDGTGTHDRFSMPVHQAELDKTATFELPTQIAEEPDMGLVFEAVGRSRPSSTLRKGIAVGKFVLRRVGQAASRPDGHRSISGGRR
jgi:hypothetical protein